MQDVFANKFIDGIPHTVEVLNVSRDAIGLRRILEPESSADAFAVELCFGDQRFWAWTRVLWRRGSREALRIVGADPIEHARFRHAVAGGTV